MNIQKYKKIVQKLHQGNDIGTQYRSAIFCSTKLQKNKVDKFINSIQSNYVKKIVTEVKYGETFFKAEEYHFDYFKKNSPLPIGQLTAKVDKPNSDSISSNNSKGS